MILGPDAKPLDGTQPQPEHRIEIVRSFSFKLNLGDYQSADFFCSRKEQCNANNVDEISTSIYEWCYDEVMESVKQVKVAQAQKRAAQAARSAA
jgi:hypothetical protein